MKGEGNLYIGGVPMNISIKSAKKAYKKKSYFNLTWLTKQIQLNYIKLNDLAKSI